MNKVSVITFFEVIFKNSLRQYYNQITAGILKVMLPTIKESFSVSLSLQLKYPQLKGLFGKTTYNTVDIELFHRT